MGALITFIITKTGLGSLAATIAVYAVIAALAGGSLWAYGAYKHHEGYAAGQLAERLVWQEQQRKAQVKAEAKAKSQQAEIDAAALAYADHQHADDLHISSLEQAIRDQKDEDLGPSDPKTGPAKTVSACHAGIPARVSVGIDAVGR